MSKADEIFIRNVREILNEGYSDQNLDVRPRWKDGTPAHTIKKFGIVNRYDLRDEFPIITLRRTFFKTCIDEMLWIWQKKSNNITRPEQRRMGQLGGRNGQHRQGLRLSACVEAQLSRGRVRPSGQAFV